MIDTGHDSPAGQMKRKEQVMVSDSRVEALLSCVSFCFWGKMESGHLSESRPPAPPCTATAIVSHAGCKGWFVHT